ncbi:MAG: hypothetical protein K2K77_03585, partial [Duncaniella sp.]|nr:hypothetical protein [Duncaniella sp.]
PSPTPTPAVRPESETPATSSPDPVPELALWELMRKDVTPSCRDGDDDTDRVLTHAHTSIWDLD